MNPSLPDPAASSPLATLRQLKEMLDAGIITPQEFETLKQRLIFGAEATADTPASSAPAPAAADSTGVLPTPYIDTPAALTPEATPLLAPEPDWLAAAAPPLFTADAVAGVEPAVAAERRNPLNLVFAIGGLLLFLGVVAYLTLDRPTARDEHLTSTTQTAADTTAITPEVGPQAEQLTLPPAAAPETVRVVPAVVPVVTPTAAADSAAAMPEKLPKPQPAPAKAIPATQPTAPKAAPAAAPAPADSAAGKP